MRKYKENTSDGAAADNILKVVLLEESTPRCKQILDALNKAGYTVKAVQAKSAGQLSKALASGRRDLIIATHSALVSQYQALREFTASRGAPPMMIAVHDLNAADYARVLGSGARFALLIDDPDSIRLVIDRELNGRGTDHPEAPAWLDTAADAEHAPDSQDLLTGLFSHQHLLDVFDAIADQRPDEGRSNALLYVKVDNLDDIQQRLGEAGAALVLYDLASLVRRNVADRDIPFRLRDETFAVVVCNQSREYIDELARTLLARVAGYQCDAPGGPIKTPCSIGVSLFGQEQITLESIISKANLACEVAQDEGGGHFHVYDRIADAQLHSARQSTREDEIRAALAKDRFVTVFQPVVNLHASPGENYEILLRMLDDRGREILPAEFMSAAVHANLMPDVDRWVIHAGLETIKKRRGEHKGLRLFIKLDPQTLADPVFLRWLSEQLRDSRVKGDQLVFEFSEPGVVRHGDLLQKTIAGLQQLHCLCALEHAGRSAEGPDMVRELAVNYVKIDGALTHDLAASEAHRARVKALVEASRSTGKLTIVPFVEDAKSLSLLWRWGADYIQGNYVQRPDVHLQYAFE